MTRKTLKDFLRNNIGKNVETVSYTLKTEDGISVEGVSDLGVDPNTDNDLISEKGLTGNYLEHIYNGAQDFHKVIGGNQVIHDHLNFTWEECYGY